VARALIDLRCLEPFGAAQFFIALSAGAALPVSAEQGGAKNKPVPKSLGCKRGVQREGRVSPTSQTHLTPPKPTLPAFRTRLRRNHR
jgi:hypothetical protein